MGLIERVNLNGKSLQEQGLRSVNCYCSTEGGGRFSSGESDLLKKKKKEKNEKRNWERMERESEAYLSAAAGMSSQHNRTSLFAPETCRGLSDISCLRVRVLMLFLWSFSKSLKEPVWPDRSAAKKGPMNRYSGKTMSFLVVSELLWCQQIVCQHYLWLYGQNCTVDDYNAVSRRNCFQGYSKT